MSNAGSLRLGVTVLVSLSLFPLISVFGQDTPTHGLKGFYYSPDYLQRGISYDEYWMPTPSIEPVAERIDAQIAFGRRNGFQADQSEGRVGPWAPDKNIMAVIWRGFIHLPKAGTYYIAPVSQNGSEVFLQQARVALNGQGGGFIASEAFTYPDLSITEALPDRNPATVRKADDRYSYLVPVTVDRPRDFPIEVRVVFVNMGSPGFGIDLYWVTPDSPTGDDGKPIAEIVPTDALFVDLQREPATVSAARSTLASDHLYFPLGVEDHATLNIRIVDTAGEPLPGRRVHVSTLSDYGPRDVITQPEPTDENGMTTARVELADQIVGHSSRFFATVIGDLVDISQVAEIVVAESSGLSFLPPAYAPYYDKGTFDISPEPLAVGRPATITVPLTNRQNVPYELYIAVVSQESNIGAVEWNPLGRTESIVLPPGATREVTLTWIPEQALAHICFKVVVWGNETEQSARVFPSLGLVGAAHAAGPPAPLESRQQNSGPVSDFLDWLAEKLYGGGIPMGGPVRLDPRTGRVGADLGPLGSASFGATEGSDPTKDIVSFKWSSPSSWFGFESSVRISDPMQNRVSSPYGGLGSKTGAAVRANPGCDPQFPEQC